MLATRHVRLPRARCALVLRGRGRFCHHTTQSSTSAQSAFTATFDHLPDFDSLPPVEGMPRGCAWGVFDRDGKKDRLGCLNLLTPAVVRAAFQEACDGVSISLDWPLDALKQPGFSRKAFRHEVFSFQDTLLNFHGWDEEVEFNTQSSSQWDSLVHYAHQPTALNYNGVRASRGQLVQDEEHGDRDLDRHLPTLDHWHDRGGLVGRGVLLDYRAYAAARGITYDCFSTHAISVQDLEAVATHQGTEFKPGDILLVRTGLTEMLQAADGPEQARMLGTSRAVGVKGCRETAAWLWNHQFAAVAGDTIAFESVPSQIEDEGGREGTLAELGQL